MGGLVHELLEDHSFDDELIAILTPIRTSREGDTRSDIVEERSLHKQPDQLIINEKAVDQDEDHQCVTPTREAALLKPALVCPPAPRKKKLPTVLKRRKPDELEPLPDFFVDVPEDLASCFIPIIRPRNVVCKKIRVV